MLREFVQDHREEILARARLRLAARNVPVATDEALTKGLPAFLEQLCEALRKAEAHEAEDHTEIRDTAIMHGRSLFAQGLTVAQVVHDYGDICQVITGFAMERKATIEPKEFQTLNLCLDDAIAGAVTSYQLYREGSIADEDNERLGILAHEMRNVLNGAFLSFASIKRGTVAIGGSTGAILERSLLRLQALIDRSLADVRLDAGIMNLERVAVWEVIDEVSISAAAVAQTRGLTFAVTSVDATVIVEADRQILAAAVANLVQNALKFTRLSSTVQLRAIATSARVLIEIEDECGGLPADGATTIMKPFVQKGRDRTGLGLGLAICLKAAKAIGGDLRVRDMPGKGCVFTLDLPKQPPPPTYIHAHKTRISEIPPKLGKASTGDA